MYHIVPPSGYVTSWSLAGMAVAISCFLKNHSQLRRDNKTYSGGDVQSGNTSLYIVLRRLKYRYVCYGTSVTKAQTEGVTPASSTEAKATQEPDMDRNCSCNQKRMGNLRDNDVVGDVISNGKH
jgi:hypothetical protein